MLILGVSDDSWSNLVLPCMWEIWTVSQLQGLRLSFGLLWASGEWTSRRFLSTLRRKLKVRDCITAQQLSHCLIAGICVRVGLSPRHFTSNPATCYCAQESSGTQSKYLGPCPPGGRTRWNSRLLASAWLSPSCFGYLGSELTKEKEISNSAF